MASGGGLDLGASLYLAAKKGDSARVRSLFAAGADLHSKPVRHRLLMLLLARCSSVNASAGEEPLHAAALHGHCDVVRTLVELGASVRNTDKVGRTPLHCAALHGHCECVVLLIASGSDKDALTRTGLTALTLAVTGCHCETVAALLEAGANPRAAHSSIPLLLHCAARNGDVESVRALLTSGVSAKDTAPGSRRTALHDASTADVVTLLLTAGAEVDALDALGRTPLHGRVEGGLHHPSVLRLLLAAGADPCSADTDGATPLHAASGSSGGGAAAAVVAAAGGVGYSAFSLASLFPGEEPTSVCVGGALVLLGAGAAPDATDKRGRTPLHLVLLQEASEYARGRSEASAGLLALAVTLVAAGGSLSARDASGRTPLVSQRQADLLRAPGSLVATAAPAGAAEVLSVGSGGEWSELHAAAALGDSEKLRRLLKGGGGSGNLAEAAARVARVLNSPAGESGRRAEGGESPLGVAAAGGHLECVKLLLSPLAAGGSSKNIRDDVDCAGATPLHAAAAGGHVAVAQALLSAGCDPNAVDRQKRTPLLLACLGGHLALARLLLEVSGATVNVNYGHGSTLLFAVAQVPGPEAVELALTLMSKGANHLTATYTGAPSHGRSPLAAAAAAGHLEMASLLIERGAEVKESDWAGTMPLDGVRHSALRRLLRSYDAEVQRSTEHRAAAATALAAEAAAEEQRRRLREQQEALDAAARAARMARDDMDAVAAATAAAEHERRLADEEARRLRVESQAVRRRERAIEEAAARAEEEKAWRASGEAADAAGDVERFRMEQEELRYTLSCPACVARMHREQARGGRKEVEESREGRGVLGGLLRFAVVLSLGAAAGAAAATYRPDVRQKVQEVAEKGRLAAEGAKKALRLRLKGGAKHKTTAAEPVKALF